MSFPYKACACLLFLFISTPLILPQNAHAKEKEIENKELLLLAEEATRDAISLRKLKPKAKIETRVTNKKEVQDYIQQRFDETGAATEFSNFSKILEIFRVIDKPMALDMVMKDLLVEQVAGYYDWEKQTLYIADWLPDILQKPTLVHEVVHALQDQHFRLGRFMVPLKGYGDPLSAIQCLFEGDATMVMVDSMAASMGMKGGIPEEVQSMLIRVMETQMTQELSSMAGLGDIPPILSSMLVFPYLGGLKMVLSLRGKKGWKPINALYKNPPLSTEQILHPEKLSGKEKDYPQDIRYTMPTVLAKDGWTQIGTDSFGEFGFRELLDHHIDTDQARRAAAGWDGDRFLLLKKGETNAHALLWVSVWDSQEDATEARETLASIFDTSIQLSQSKTRLAAIWEHGAPLPRALLQGLLKNAKADELRDFNTVVHRGTRK